MAACRACGAELDRQGMGKSPMPIPSIGAAVDFREAARTADADIQAAREVLPPAVAASLGGCDGDIYEMLKDELVSAAKKAELVMKLGRRDI